MIENPYYGEDSHPDCNHKTGHVCQEPTGKLCWEHGCDQEAGTKWGPYWCPDHDAVRLDRISRGMAKIAEEVGMRDRGEPDEDSTYEVIRIRQCLGSTARGKRCRRNGRANANGYLCPMHRDQDGVEEGSR